MPIEVEQLARKQMNTPNFKLIVFIDQFFSHCGAASSAFKDSFCLSF